MTSAVPSVASSPTISINSSPATNSDSGFSDTLSRAQSRKPADQTDSSGKSPAPAKGGGKAHGGGGHGKTHAAASAPQSVPATKAKPAAPPTPDDAEEDSDQKEDAAQDDATKQPLVVSQGQTPQAKFKTPTVKTDSEDEKEDDEKSGDSEKTTAPQANPAAVAPVKGKQDTTKDQSGKKQGKSSQSSQDASSAVSSTAQTADATAVAASTATVDKSDPSQETTAATTPDDSSDASAAVAPVKQPNVSIFKGSSGDASADTDAGDATDSTDASATTSSAAAPADTDDDAATAVTAAFTMDKIKAFAKTEPIDSGASSSLAAGEAGALKPAAPHGSAIAAAAAPDTPTPSAPSAEEIAQTNHAQIVSTIHGQLLPNGGTMQITMNPPELGALQINVNVHDGVVSASFETSNDDATRLLSRSLGQLKSALETQGIGVERLHVQQTSNSEQSNSKGSGEDSNNGRQSTEDQRSAQQEEQRREVMRRLWRRVSGAREDLDMVA